MYVAFFVTLLVQPLSVSRLGFWLSYIAVFALGLVWYRSQSQCLWQRIVQLFCAQAALSLLLLPVIALSTGYFSPMGPLVNILLVPIFSLLLIPALLLIGIGALVMPLAGFISTSLDFILVLLWQGLEGLTRLPWTQVFVGWLPFKAFLSIFLVACLCLLIRRWHWPLLSLLIPLALYIMLKLLDLPTNYGKINSKWVMSSGQELDIQPSEVVTMFDVGQGLSIWLNQGQHNMLYDVSNRYQSGFNLVDAVILPELQVQGIHGLDLVMISHWDIDHSGGLGSLLQQQRIQRLILPPEIKPKR